jgi:predicted GNAT family N-acyltransferase
MTVSQIVHGSPEYAAAVELRRRVLRLPLGMDFSAAELAAEVDQFHFGIWDGEELVGCLSLVRNGPSRLVSNRDEGSVGSTEIIQWESQFKMRQVAVSPDRQRQGIGKRLVEAAEAFVDTGEISLHAREVAVAFYESMGYTTVGEPFLEVGILHMKMTKRVG